MSNILLDVWKLVWKNVFRSIVIIFGLFLLQPLDFWKLTGFIILVNTVYHLLVFDEPSLKVLIKTHIITVLVLGGLYLVYLVGGFFGVIGLVVAGVVTLFSLTAITIYSNWKIYDAVTTWGAERILGKHKKEFNLKKVMQNNKKNKNM